MARTLTINITDISVRPYGYTSPLAEDPKAFDLFDTRSDFARMEGMTHLAVAFRTENLRSKYSWSLINRRKSHHTFWVNVVYPGSRIPVTSRTVYVEMDPEEDDGIERVDIPLRMSQICENQFYEVEIVAPGINDDTPLISKQFRIVNLRGLAPSKYYIATEASLHTRQMSTCFFSDYDTDSHYAYPLGNAQWRDGEKQLFITFKLSKNYCAPYLKPEIMVRLYRRFEDKYTDVRASVYDAEAFNHQYISDDEMYVQVPVTDRMGKDDYIYAEVQALGCPVAGAVFDIEENRDPLKGVLTGDDIKFIPCFNSIKAINIILQRRRKLEEEQKAEELKKAADTPTVSEMLERLTGLERVKSKVTSYRQLMEFNRRRSDAGLPSFKAPLHCMFLGSPGTGKTTVAKMLGKILNRCGVLSSGHVVVRERATLIGQYYSSEGENIRNALEEAQGGILFIDEAYQLHQPHDPKDPGRFVLESLMTALADESNRDWMLILAGYTEPMLEMFKINPGLRSRIPETNYYVFEDYSADQLMEIAERYLAEREFALDDDARTLLRTRLSADYVARDKSFGNARHVINLIETGIFPAMAARISTLETPCAEDLSTIRGCDIPLTTEKPILTIQPRTPMGFKMRS